MKKICAFTVMFLTSALAFGQEESERPRETGPFGLWMGMTLEDVKQIDPAPQQMPNNKYEWMVSAPPTPHPQLKFYVVRIHESTGLCQIRAGTESFSSDSHGVEVRNKLNGLASAISQRYGEPKVADFLFPGSIWKDPQDFMMGLYQKERLLQAEWEDLASSQHGGVLDIRLTATAINTSVAMVIGQFSFENSEECKAAIERDDSKAF